MKIVNITYTDTGGAGTAVVRTHKRLQELGYNSLLFLASDRKVKNTLINKITRRFENYSERLKRVFIKQPNATIVKEYLDKYCFYSTSELEKISVTSILEQIEDGDIIMLYWLGEKMLNTSNIVQLSKKRKVKLVWYALDMSPVTGGCHYFWDCTGYQTSCLNCPAFKGEAKSLAYHQFLSKSKNLQKVSVKLICSSHTGINILKKTALKFEGYSVLPFAIDTTIFDVPTPKPVAATNGFLIFFNAQNINDIRKGWSYFKETIFLLDQLLISSGHSNNVSILSVAYDTHLPHFEKLKKIKLVDMGCYANGEKDLAALYQSSNVLVCTSVEDLTPLMVNEALLCGTPVIGFDNASNKEYIIENRNGNLVAPFNVVEMAEIIFKVIRTEITYDSSKDIRESVFHLHESISWNRKFTEVILDN
jgi:glycosyltransferase involved in cell wall biosynthesis